MSQIWCAQPLREALIIYDTWQESLWSWKSGNWLMMVRPASLSLIFLTELCEWGGRVRLRKRRQGAISDSQLCCCCQFFLFLVIPFLLLMWHVISRGVSGGQGRRRRRRRRLGCTSRISKALLRPGCCRTSELNGHFCPEHNRMWLQRTDEGGKWVFDTDALHTQQAHVLMNEPDDLSSPWQSFMGDSRCAWIPSPLPFNI